MYSTKAVRLVLAIVAAVTTVPAAAVLCHPPLTSNERMVPLGAMRSQTPLFVTDHSGRLAKMNLGTGARTIVSDHGFNMAPSVSVSGDGRWLSYGGRVKGSGKLEYWLYDAHKHSERLIFPTPPRWGGTPTFSPDGRYLVTIAGYAGSQAGDRRAGIYLFDIATMRLQLLPLATPKPRRTELIHAAWSQDGKELLILAHISSGSWWSDDKEFGYFIYGLASGRLETVAGRYNRLANGHDFFRGARRIPAAEEIQARSYRSDPEAWTPGRGWRAYVEEQGTSTYRLLATSKQGVTRQVAGGDHGGCSGHPFHINGWLDERHLIYRNNGFHFVFDVQTGTTAELFKGDSRPDMFTW